MLKMLCAEGSGGEDVVRAGEAWAVIGLGIGIVVGLQGVFGGAKFCSGGSCEPGLGLKLGLRVGSATGLTGREG